MTTTSTNLQLPGSGTLTVRDTVLQCGRVKYSVSGPRIKQCALIISPETLRDGAILPTTVTVQYGDGQPGRLYVPRPDEPVVSGIRIHGFTSRLDPARIPEQDFLGEYAGAASTIFTTRIPDGARTYMEAVVRSLLAHWQSRPDRAALVRAAAVATADEYARYEDAKATKLEDEIRSVVQKRVDARREVNVLTGLVRRRQTAVRPADPTPVKVPFFDHLGGRIGDFTVREQSVSGSGHTPGNVVYEVDGPRVRGSFTVGREVSSASPWPGGVRIVYGVPIDDGGDEATDEPVINTIRLQGRWRHRGDTDSITVTSPGRLSAPRRMASAPHQAEGRSVPEATQHRAFGVLRALALRYLARPDAEALHLAAAKDRAPGLLLATRQRLRNLAAEQRKLSTAARQHRERASRYRELLTLAAAPLAVPDVQSDPAGTDTWDAEGGACPQVQYARRAALAAAEAEAARVKGGSALQRITQAAERARQLAVEAADSAEEAARRSRGTDTARLDTIMIAAHESACRAERYARWSAESAADQRESPARQFAYQAVACAVEAQSLAGADTTAAGLRDLLERERTESERVEQARLDRELRECVEAELRAETGMDADNRLRAVCNQMLAEDCAPALGWSTSMARVMEVAAAGRLYRRDGFAWDSGRNRAGRWEGGRKVSRERALILARAGFLSVGRKSNRAITLSPMGEVALALVRLNPEALHSNDRAAYEARHAAQPRARMSSDQRKDAARRLPRLDTMALRLYRRPVTIAERDQRVDAAAEAAWDGEGGACAGVEPPAPIGTRDTPGSPPQANDHAGHGHVRSGTFWSTSSSTPARSGETLGGAESDRQRILEADRGIWMGDVA
ncbi:hypothetical protein [Streptomyces sp. NPDC058268]|uniref:hypothetical protein n=1 Tax=Streptomyces sp. NPDC058268 TaxID=3346413 RepID=UPI0036E4B2CE